MADYSPNRIPDSVKERFWSKVDVRGPDECWEWQGCRDEHGYGRIGFFTNGVHRTYVTSRFARMITDGIAHPPHIVTRHMCHNPPCVNPRHLLWGTQKDNAQDDIDAGKVRGSPCKKVCSRGHDISDNSAVYMLKTGRRAGKRSLCKKCSAVYRKERRDADKAAGIVRPRAERVRAALARALREGLQPFGSQESA